MAKRFLDLTGKKFGDWTVLRYAGNQKWTCKCSCGNIKDIRSDALRNGKSKSCGCKKINDIKDKKFGEWTAKYYVGNSYWHCVCSCGKERDVLQQHLVNGNSTSCGHTRKSNQPIDLTGKKFGDWTVLGYAGNQKWTCKCSCGNIKDVRSEALRQGRSKSCGHNEILDKLRDIKGAIIGEWTVLEYSGNKRWKCKCSCGTIKDIQTSHLMRGLTKSCGCKIRENFRNTMINKYGEVATNRILTPRTDEQIELTSSKKALEEFLINYEVINGCKISTFDLEEYLGIEHNTVIWLINKFELDKYIEYYSGRSHIEDEIINYITSLDNNIDIVLNDRNTIKPQELDIVIPSKKIAIEINGDYWHSEEFKDSKYHQNKSIKCMDIGIRVIHIFEHEWKIKSSKEKVKNIIRNSIIGVDTVLYARKCEIRRVSNNYCREFFNRYHMKNSVNSELIYGLFYNEEPVQFMAFSKPRFNTKYEYEITRLCTKANCVVIGGANKIFKRFLCDTNAKSVIAYNDIAKFSGNIYKEIGMKFYGYTNPNYIWINKRNMEILTRYQTQKEKLIKDGKGNANETEDMIMKKNGYFKVYDCGNSIYTFQRR